ncbi:type I toxin-antitoxin system Fst family toxin [Lactiplantibacillus plantarum]|nr:type I toxin-antitoxin system Fst family toxin [Lactiplantibacillus plantarum]
MLHDILSLIVAPILVGIVNKLFSYWLDKCDKDNNH